MSAPRGIDRLFDRLTIRFGGAFLDQWKGIPLEEVKADWIEELRAFAHAPEVFAWALENLPERAPNVGQFKSLCKVAPRKPVPALPSPPHNPVKARACMALVAATLTPRLKTDAKHWARVLIAKHDSGEKVAVAALNAARQALRYETTTEETQQ